ncbi:hypothetical protein PF008_g4449 [Phytophthora fragariae]|uniref:Uncharacterized protein n=1 Tax=Phytophthora fragariae TaxID=53985 RepID=A0A6G0SBJ1_9STRA|nr:hypothetical protein PF008_g4449 [Phytophthora fragariae]
MKPAKTLRPQLGACVVVCLGLWTLNIKHACALACQLVLAVVVGVGRRSINAIYSSPESSSN